MRSPEPFGKYSRFLAQRGQYEASRLAFIDPTSVHIKLDGEVIEQNYQYDLVSLEKILHKYIDNQISLVSETNEFVEGKLLSATSGQIVLEKKDGGLLMIPNVNKYRFSVDALPEGLITKPTLVWQLNSNKSGKQNVEIVHYRNMSKEKRALFLSMLRGIGARRVVDKTQPEIRDTNFREDSL